MEKVPRLSVKEVLAKTIDGLELIAGKNGKQRGRNFSIVR